MRGNGIRVSVRLRQALVFRAAGCGEVERDGVMGHRRTRLGVCMRKPNMDIIHKHEPTHQSIDQSIDQSIEVITIYELLAQIHPLPILRKRCTHLIQFQHH